MAGEMTITGPNPERVAVIVGVGQVNDRPKDPMLGHSSVELMEAALAAADRDGGGGWCRDAGSVAVVQQISFARENPLASKLAMRVGAKPAVAYDSAGPNGDSPILLLNDAVNRIAAGEIGIALVAGGEALRTASHRAAVAARSPVSERNALRDLASTRPAGYRQRYGLAAPVDVYPLYENAGRAAYGQSLAEAQRESGEIWSRMSSVAADNVSAWLRTVRSPEQIVEASADNRPIAFPYTKLMVANLSVNQGAAFIVTSLGEARRRGVPDGRIVYVGRGASAHEPEDFLARDRFDRSASMEVCLRRTLDWNGLQTECLDHAELYSCFPCIPKMARRVIGWPLDRAATVFGGLTFGGGPIGNYMSHAVAEMVHRLRGTKRCGLLFGNGGYATYNHAIALAGRALPGAGVPHAHDCQAEVDRRRDPVPELDRDYAGPAIIETYTVFYARDGSPRAGVVVARTPGDRRTLAHVPAEDVALIEFLTGGAVEPVGRKGDVVPGETLSTWRSVE